MRLALNDIAQRQLIELMDALRAQTPTHALHMIVQRAHVELIRQPKSQEDHNATSSTSH